jgi:hypothetical protein
MFHEKKSSLMKNKQQTKCGKVNKVFHITARTFDQQVDTMKKIKYIRHFYYTSPDALIRAVITKLIHKMAIL